MIRKILLFSFLLFLFGCSRQSREARLVDSYRADEDLGIVETLLLKADHMVEQTVSSKSGTVKTVNREWEMGHKRRLAKHAIVWNGLRLQDPPTDNACFFASGETFRLRFEPLSLPDYDIYVHAWHGTKEPIRDPKGASDERFQSVKSLLSCRLQPMICAVAGTLNARLQYVCLKS